jgi:hypothetical protein
MDENVLLHFAIVISNTVDSTLRDLCAVHMHAPADVVRLVLHS